MEPKITSSREVRILTAIAAALAIVLFTASHSNLQTPEYQKLDKTSSTGSELKSVDQYRFSELNQSILYGPYIANDTRYFIHQGKVLNENLKETDKPEIKNLHSFYMKTYLDPLFYSPQENEKRLDLSKFEKFESEKLLAKRCGLEYEVIPKSYFKSLEKNNKDTRRFLEKASYENAEKIIKTNQKTIKAYTEYIEDFADLLDKNVSKNKCFSSKNTSNFFVTLTPEKYKLNTDILKNYSLLANRNAQKLLEITENRSRLLKTGRYTPRSVNIDIPRIKNKIKSPVNESEVKAEINERRSSEFRLKELEDSGYDLKTVKNVNTYRMQPVCLNKTVSVTGTEMDIYPNIVSQERLFPENHMFEGLFENFFSVSKCPYAEETRLIWHITNDQHHKIEENPLYKSYNKTDSWKLESAERYFIEEPDQRHLEQTSKTYRQLLIKNLAEDRYSNISGELWFRSTQERSKLNKFEDTFDDFYNEYHLNIWRRYWPTPELGGNSSEENVELQTPSSDGKFTTTKYHSFLFMESEFPLTFMTWSEAVWKLEEKPKRFSGKYKGSKEQTNTIWQP